MECECEICKKIKGRILKEKNGKVYCFINRKLNFVADALEYEKHMKHLWEERRVAYARSRVRARARIIARGKVTKNQWLDIIKNLDNKCAYCGEKFSGTTLPTMDHIIPLNSNLVGIGKYRIGRVRGTHSVENITAACRSCNCIKGAHPPRKLLFRVTKSDYGNMKYHDWFEKIKRTPISKVREWYFQNALKFIAGRRKK